MVRKPYILEIFLGSITTDRHYWRLIRRMGGKIIADGSEAYDSKSNLKRAVKKLPINWHKIEILDTTIESKRNRKSLKSPVK